MQPDYPANLKEEVNQRKEVNQSEEVQEEVKMENDRFKTLQSFTGSASCSTHVKFRIFIHSFSCGCSRILIIHCCEECSEDLNTYKDILKNNVPVNVICSQEFFP